MTVNNSERCDFIGMESGTCLMLSAGGHLTATFRTVLAGLHAFVHTADLTAIRSAGFADFGADRASPRMEAGVA